MTSKEKLLGLKLKEESVTIDGIDFLIKELNGGDSSSYQESLYKIVNGVPISNLKNATEKLVALTVFEPDGTRMFEITDLEQIKLIPNHVVEQLFKTARNINGLGKTVKN